MKLVIDIPEERFKSIKAFNSVYPHMLAPNELAIAEGIPLNDDIDSNETVAYFDGQAYGWEEGRKALIDEVRAEIAEEICLTDNPYTKETKFTIEYSRLLDILDNIGKGTTNE